MTVKSTDALQLSELKANVENSYQTFKGNRERFNTFMRFVFKDSLSSEDREVLKATEKPELQFNILEAYISRLLGEFSKQEPNFETSANHQPVDPNTIEVVEGIVRQIVYEANKNQFEYNAYRDSLGGGFSGFRVGTKYREGNTFEQDIFLEKIYDPTFVIYDPNAQQPHKQDGRYCAELFPMTEQDFKYHYPNINIDEIDFNNNLGSFKWYYKNNKQKIILVCRYYHKRKTRQKLLYLSNRTTVTAQQYKDMLANWNTIEQPPQIVKERWRDKVVIDKYEFIENQILNVEKTQFPNLPLIFVDGNSALVKEEGSNNITQVTRPYVYHAMGSQQLINFAGQCQANELENMMQNKYIVDQKSIPPEKEQDWIQPQIASTLMWQSKDKDGEPLTPPIVVNRTQIPSIITETFSEGPRTVQNILGSYDAQLGINENQLSGVAIVEGATQNNSVAMPYIVNFMSALNAAAQMIVEMIPRYYNTPRTISFIDRNGDYRFISINDILPTGEPMPGSMQLNYPENALNINITAGYNFEVQKQRALKTIISLMQASEGFKAMMEQKGLATLIDNLDIKGADKLQEMAKEFTQELEQQRQMAQQQAASGQNTNPEMLALNLKASAQNLQQEKLYVDQQMDNRRLDLETQKMINERLKILAGADESARDHMIRLIEAKTERDSKAADVVMKHMERANPSSQQKAPTNQQEVYQ